MSQSFHGPRGRCSVALILLVALFGSRRAEADPKAADAPVAEAALSGSTAGPDAAAGSEEILAPDELYARVKPATVEILVEGRLDGSGWFADPEGLLLTAAHVVDRPGRKVEIVSPLVGRREAEVVAVDLGHDIALLRAAPREGGYPALPIADQPPKIGEEVYLVGSAMFRHGVLFRGIVANEKPVFEYYGEKHVEVLHLAATVPGGTSGGPWFDRRGRVIGLQSAVMSLNSIPVGVANAAPGAALARLLAERRHAATPHLGAAVEEPWQQNRDFWKRFPAGSEGLVVVALQKDGPAERAGLRQWDMIVRADGHAVRLIDELLVIVRAKKPGETVDLEVLGPDGTGSRNVALTLGKAEVAWPDPQPRGAADSQSAPAADQPAGGADNQGADNQGAGSAKQPEAGGATDDSAG